jgi:DNA-binding transcriptional regulator GbsR (MarR family)
MTVKNNPEVLHYKSTSMSRVLKTMGSECGKKKKKHLSARKKLYCVGQWFSTFQTQCPPFSQHKTLASPTPLECRIIVLSENLKKKIYSSNFSL